MYICKLEYTQKNEMLESEASSEILFPVDFYSITKAANNVPPEFFVRYTKDSAVAVYDELEAIALIAEQYQILSVTILRDNEEIYHSKDWPDIVYYFRNGETNNFFPWCDLRLSK